MEKTYSKEFAIRNFKENYLEQLDLEKPLKKLLLIAFILGYDEGYKNGQPLPY